MIVEQTIKNSLLLFPSIFRNYTDVMEHLFCVIGNGYEWKNGELVESGEEKEKIITVQDAIKKAIHYNLIETPVIELKLSFLEIDNEFNEEGIKKIIKELGENLEGDVKMCFRLEERYNDREIPTIENYPDQIHQIPGELEDEDNSWTFYPLCEYSKLCCLPDDIKDDWLEAAKWMVEFIKTHKTYIRKCDFDKFMGWLNKAEERINELQLRKRNE